ncbi:hypothetical protein [uncultured Chitinophaga sp.]|nr:hypothetical protein [uncultured Chitinophaga sp.]
MNNPFISFMREARLFIYTPGIIHLGIVQLLVRLLLRKRLL